MADDSSCRTQDLLNVSCVKVPVASNVDTEHGDNDTTDKKYCRYLQLCQFLGWAP